METTAKSSVFKKKETPSKKDKEKAAKLQMQVAVIDINMRGMVSSLAREKSLFVGCRDGTLFEIDVKKLRIVRELQTECTISAIADISPDMLAIGQTSGSGWVEQRGCIMIVKLVAKVKIDKKKKK
jgi:hypothetical protein